MSIEVLTYESPLLGENTYLVRDISTGRVAIIDPGTINEEIISQIGNKENLKYVILTHAHYDHFFAGQDYVSMFPNAKFVGPAGETYLMSKDCSNVYVGRNITCPDCPKCDVLVTEDDKLNLGETIIHFINTPGHTEGGMCVLIDDKLFSGDTLFRLSVGNTSFETGNFEQLANSIREKLYILEDNITVYPGHGPTTTIGYEKKANPFV